MGKKLAQHTPAALVLGFIAFLVVVIADLAIPDNFIIIKGLPWITFIGWPTYFMSGSTPSGGAQNIVSFIIGAFSAIVIFEFAKIMGGSVWAVAASVGIIAALLFYFELAPKILQHVPAMFVAAAVFIGLTHFQAGDYPTVFVTTVFYLAFGTLCGFLTVSFIQWNAKRSGNAE